MSADALKKRLTDHATASDIVVDGAPAAIIEHCGVLPEEQLQGAEFFHILSGACFMSWHGRVAEGWNSLLSTVRYLCFTSPLVQSGNVIMLEFLLVRPMVREWWGHDFRVAGVTLIRWDSHHLLSDKASSEFLSSGMSELGQPALIVLCHL